MGFLSEKMPKRGWTREELTVAAKTSAPAAASERPRSEIKNGSSAATAPWLRSVKRWPDERTPIALRSTPFFGAALKLPSYRLRPRRCYQSSEILYGSIAQTRPGSSRNSRLTPSRISSTTSTGSPGPGRPARGTGILRSTSAGGLPHTPELAGLPERLPEAADAVDEPPLQGLGAAPDPAPGDGVHVGEVPAPGDPVLELVVDEPDLVLQHPQLVLRRRAAGVHQAGALSPLEPDRVHAELP
jgi:hypothetical protein